MWYWYENGGLLSDRNSVQASYSIYITISTNNTWFGGHPLLYLSPPSTGIPQNNAISVVSTWRGCPGQCAWSIIITTQPNVTEEYCVVRDDYLGWGGVLRSVRDGGGGLRRRYVVVAAAIGKLWWSTQHCATLCTTSRYTPHQETYPRWGRIVLLMLWSNWWFGSKGFDDDDYCIIFAGADVWMLQLFMKRGTAIKIPASSAPPRGWN